MCTRESAGEAKGCSKYSLTLKFCECLIHLPASQMSDHGIGFDRPRSKHAQGHVSRMARTRAAIQILCTREKTRDEVCSGILNGVTQTRIECWASVEIARSTMTCDGEFFEVLNESPEKRARQFQAFDRQPNVPLGLASLGSPSESKHGEPAVRVIVE
jgi:hypothetical protein